MRFIDPVRQDEATGLVAQTYQAVERYMGAPALARNGPFLAHSPAPELLAAFWNAAYETVLVDGSVPRAEKHAIAAVVSKINECPFCLQTHAYYSGLEGDLSDIGALMSGAIDDIADVDRRRFAEWAAATRDPSGQGRETPFTSEQAPEAIGTAFAFHYLDRVVTFFDGDSGIDVGETPFSVVESLTRSAIQRDRKPGASLVPLSDGQLPEDLRWAAASPHVAAALAGFVATAEAAGAAALDEAERTLVAAAIDEWDGSDPPIGEEWIEDVLTGIGSQPARARARLALIAALAPHRIDEATVAAFRQDRPDDGQLVGAVAWSASRAARRIGSWLGVAEEAAL